MSDPESNFLKKVIFTLVEISNTLSTSLKNKTICVCLSGGADSVSLLVALNMLKSKYEFALCAAHVNHLLRGDESFRDENFCIELCVKLGIKLHTTRIDIKKLSKENKKSIEEAARDARYSYFGELGKQYSVDYFATAHTKNDNAETVYMNIIRGTTVSGLCGIPQINGNTIRPLLNMSREENEEFLSTNGFSSANDLSFVIDSSNSDNNYTRNYIRNVLLPTAKKINSQVIEAVDRLSEFARIDEGYFNSVLDTLPADIKYSELHPSLLKRKLQRDYSLISGKKSLMTVHLDALISLLNSGQKKRQSMPDGITALIKDGKINFVVAKSIKKIIDNGIYELKYGENIFADGMVKIYLSKNNSVISENIYNNYTYTKLSFGKIIGSVKYRARKTGDRIFSLGVSKSIKKQFIEKGIPEHLREAIPIFFDDKEIVYVPFIGAADRVYSQNDDEDSVTITVQIKTDVPITKGRN
ncbi:MAG: tRNA lysidine(34) synthetase TilS [Clostridiales bacterium GWF2_36_10]|nr:MAG: tRNA lysidine(34) synthetase TilS [Clostridiales bacterium GWF2_36_10]